MKNPERRPRSKTAGGSGPLRRWLDALGDMINGSGQLVPVPVSAPATGSFPRREADPFADSIHRVFGRRKDEPPKDEAPKDGPPASEPPPENASPAPSPFGEGGREESDLAQDGRPEAAAPAIPGWSAAPDSAPAQPSPFSYEPTNEQPDLPAWTPSTSPTSEFPSFSPEAEAPSAPWAGGLEPDDDDEEPTSYSPVADSRSLLGDEPAWPAGQAESPWPASQDEEGTSSPFVGPTFPDQGELPEVGEVGEEEPGQVAAVAPEETGEEPGPSFEEEPMPEVVAVSESAWSVATPDPEPLYHVAVAPEPAVHQAAIALVEDARAFPLPEGEVIFRNLRSGFTDPARLLRHLAGEGHTGVMHVSGADERNTYIVLVDGYVVAVASDDHGRLTTTNRVSFPSFPNSQDTLNVISYEREIARGLGLLLHAPVHFRGLGAMFVNLDGLRSYLSKRSASGGMVVQSDTGTGVALFDDGRLVGVYSGSGSANTDLAPLRELIKDLDSEIDVRFGGPKELDPIPLDTLLAGYPL